MRALLAEEPALRDTGLYHTVLAAIAEGSTTRGGIASRIERKAGDISHHLTVLQDAGFIAAEQDAFRLNRSQYRITEPLVLFYHAIMRPYWSQLEHVRPGRTERIWESSRARFLSNVVGPVFERMCRVWTQDMAAPETLGGYPAKVLSGVVVDSSKRIAHEVDVAAFDADGQLLAIGEAKWGTRMNREHLARLTSVADLLAEHGRRPGVLLLFSGEGFSDDLARTAATSRGQVQLVDLTRLYSAG